MMPDNKDPSDTAGEQAADDVANDPVNEDTLEVVSEQHASSADPAGEDPATDNDDDPLGFGEQRMNDADPEPQDEVAALTSQLAEAEAKTAEHWDLSLIHI